MNIDYTKWRKGKTTRWYKGLASERIAVCPKCGRKGSCRPAFIGPDGQWFPTEYTHKATVSGIAFFVEDYCTLWESFIALYNAGVRRSKSARRAAKGTVPDTDWPALPYAS